MKYIDGFVLPVPKKNLKAYAKISKIAGKVWKKHGALEYRECVGEDLDINFGIPFPKLLSPKKGETIVFSWILYKSRAHRDRVNAKVMKDPRMTSMCMTKMPFDCNRMHMGGFEVFVDMG